MASGHASARPHAARLDERLAGVLAEGRPSFSFEFFPPKDDGAEVLLWDAIRRLEPLNPTFVSVTYGAGGSTRDRTTRITRRIAQDTTLTPMAHLTCVGASVAELRHVIGAYADAGVSTIMALRGDPQAGPNTPWTPHPGGLDRAIDLVRLVRDLGSFSVGVAAFPDVHPESPSLDHDARVLAAKADAGASFAVTQMVFDPEAYVRLVELTRRHHCDIPIIPGIMPVTNVRSIVRSAQLTGAALPSAIVDRLHAVSDDPAAVRAVGVDIATEISQRLLDAGAPGLHFYTMNRSTATLEVFGRLGVAVRS